MGPLPSDLYHLSSLKPMETDMFEFPWLHLDCGSINWFWFMFTSRGELFECSCKSEVCTAVCQWICLFRRTFRGWNICGTFVNPESQRLEVVFIINHFRKVIISFSVNLNWLLQELKTSELEKPTITYNMISSGSQANSTACRAAAVPRSLLCPFGDTCRSVIEPAHGQGDVLPVRNEWFWFCLLCF